MIRASLVLLWLGLAAGCGRSSSVDPRDGSGTDGGGAVCVDDGADAGRSPDAPTRPEGVSFGGNLVYIDEPPNCPPLEQTAPFLMAVSRGLQPLPPPLKGGRIRDGRYELVLVEVNFVSSLSASEEYYRRTLEISDCGTRWLMNTIIRESNADDGRYWQVRTEVALEATGEMLTARYQDRCWPGDQVSYLFEATEDTIVMWFEPAGTLMTYLRRP
jgi:hypothetical protein